MNGLRIEVIGMGIILPLAPNDPLLYDTCIWSMDSLNQYSSICNGFAISSFGNAHAYEKINGIQLSGLCSYTGQVNGITIGLALGNITRVMNGFSFGGISNSSIKMTGVQMAILYNKSYKMRGIQIGLYNRTEIMRGIQIGLWNRSNSLKGIQIGIWNKNQKRSLPLINWNF